MRGIETLTVNLANALAEKGIEVSLITAAQTLKNLRVTPDPQVKVYAYPTFRYFEHLTIVPFSLHHFLHHQYDYVVVFFADFGEGLTWRLLQKWKRDLPLVLYLCYPYSSVPHRYRSFMKLGWDKKARHIWGDSRWIAKEVGELFGRKVPVLPVGTNPERMKPNPAFRTEWRRHYGLQDTDLMILTVSALEYRKGIWRGIEAMARLAPRFPHLKYCVLGTGKDESKLKKMVKDLGLEHRVLFPGAIANPENFYSLADIFLMLPDAEANSVACHEAMACGLPVVVSQTEGFTENVSPDAGFFVDPDSPDEIDLALTPLITDSSLRERLGQNGRNHVLAHHTLAHYADRFLELLH